MEDWKLANIVEFKITSMPLEFQKHVSTTIQLLKPFVKPKDVHLRYLV